MGWYIETDSAHDKAHHIIKQHGAKICSQNEAEAAFGDENQAVIVVMDNGIFEAAGFAFDEKEFEAFTLPEDTRPKVFLVMNRNKAIELTGFKK